MYVYTAELPEFKSRAQTRAPNRTSVPPSRTRAFAIFHRFNFDFDYLAVAILDLHPSL